MANNRNDLLSEEDGDDVVTATEKQQDGGVVVKLELSPEEQKKQAEDAINAEDDAIKSEHPNADEDERARIRERRRLEKIERKERREVAIRRDRTELDFLRQQNEQLERRLAGIEQHTRTSELQGVDAQLQQALREMEMAEQVIAKAVNAGNGDDVAKAMKYRDQAIQRATQLNAVKQNELQRQNTPAQPQVDSRVLSHAQEFMKEHPWYDVHGRDEDSAVVLAIDSAMAKDGYDPKTEEYWDELRSRVSRRLPDKVQKQESRAPRGGPAVGSGKEHAPTSTRKEIYISPERKRALEEAGVWDDPVLRQKYVKRYAEYDRLNREK